MVILNLFQDLCLVALTAFVLQPEIPPFGSARGPKFGMTTPRPYQKPQPFFTKKHNAEDRKESAEVRREKEDSSLFILHYSRHPPRPILHASPSTFNY